MTASLQSTTSVAVGVAGTDAAGNGVSFSLQSATVNTTPVAPFTEPVTLASGQNTVTVPAGYLFAFIQPATGGTGGTLSIATTPSANCAISNTNPTLYGLPTGVSTFYVTSGAGGSVPIQITWS